MGLRSGLSIGGKKACAVMMILCAQGVAVAYAGVALTNLPAGSNAVAAADKTGPKFQGIYQKPVNYRVPQREYVAVFTNGWTIQVEKQLQAEDPVLAGKAVARLGLKLNESLGVLPEASREKLRKRTIFLMYGPKSRADGRDNGAEYYQPHAPECYPHLDKRWGGNIVMYSAENYVWQTDFWALKLVMHELVHAYHLEQWPEDQADICLAYEKAMSRKLYRNIRDDQGATHERAYAIQNPMEYFAELSCMYFVGCDYAPRNRKELKAYDPDGYAMIEAMWSVKDEKGKSRSKQ